MEIIREFLRKIRNRERSDVGRLYGIMSLSVYDVKRGKMERIYRITKKNQITNVGREIVLELLGQLPTAQGGTPTQNDPSYNNIWSLAIGTDSTPPTLGDTSLGAEVWKSRFNPLNTERQVDLANFEIRINKSVPAGQATDSTITEAGIFTRGDDDDPSVANYRRLYARQVHPGVLKTSTMVITYDWRLGVTIQV